MATIEKFDHGQFSWVDLMTPDAAAAKSFYETLFGWSHVDFPTDQGGVYTRFSCRDLPVAGLGEMSDNMKAGGTPAFWSSYVTVDDADAIAARAEALGGKITMPVMRVMTAGRMAFIADSEGAQFAVWEPGGHAGAGLVNEPVSFAWNELLTRDVDAARDFYGGLFEWDIESVEDSPVEYHVIRNAGRMNGGIIPWMEEMGDVPPNWGVYFSVPDCDAAVAKLEALGGRVCVPPRDIEPGRFAVVADPAGAIFSVMYVKNPD